MSTPRFERMSETSAGLAAMPRWLDIIRTREPVMPSTLQVNSIARKHSSKHDADHEIYKDLVKGSEPEPNPNTYTGPPIGFAAMTVFHTAADSGKGRSVLHGTLDAPRPVFAMICSASECAICRPQAPPICVVGLHPPSRGHELSRADSLAVTSGQRQCERKQRLLSEQRHENRAEEGVRLGRRERTG